MRFPWLQVDLDFITAHSRDLGALLGVSRREAMGLAMDLWTWVLGRSTAAAPPDGMVRGPCAARLLAGAVDWTGDPATLLEALVGAGLAERIGDDVRVRGMWRYGSAYTRRVRAKPEALAWSRLHPGVPLPPTQPEPLEEGVELPFPEIRLRTPEEQAAYFAEAERRMAPIRAERAEQARLRARRWVYFIQAGDAGPIKIGISRDVGRRRGELQRMEREPLHIRATIEGTPRDERDLHARFAEHRLHGEWFSPAPELLSHINALNGVKS